MFSVLMHNTFTVQILYSLQLNCTYSNYTEAAATCSAAQQHSTFTVPILYKQYSLQLNCTYSNYAEAAATCSAVQQHTNCPLMSSEVQCRPVWYYILQTHISRNQFFQINLHDCKRPATPQLPSATQHLPISLSGDCTAAKSCQLIRPVRWRTSRMWPDGWGKRLNTHHFLPCPQPAPYSANYLQSAGTEC